MSISNRSRLALAAMAATLLLTGLVTPAPAWQGPARSRLDRCRPWR
ncbi:MAG: hypothetical protein HZY76_16675 [Anaerolineae bacterium]|nr:MAG: hypothetical protein HZY76_16675 [Anaerolineae bacterium]